MTSLFQNHGVVDLVRVLRYRYYWYCYSGTIPYRKQRRLRSQYSQPHFHIQCLTSLQLNEYSDADDAATITTSNRGRKKRNVDII